MRTHELQAGMAGRRVAWLTCLVFLVAAGFYLWTEHRAHLYGVLPYLLFLACPLMHLIMHRSHHQTPARHADHQPVDGRHREEPQDA